MTQTTVYGVRESLRELRRIDPDLRRALQKDMRKAAAPVTGQLSASIPAGAPLSGLARWWQRPHRYSVRTGGRARGDQIPMLRVSVKSRGPVLADMAATGHTPQGRALVTNLGGRASRYVWPAAERALPAAVAAATTVCEQITDAANRRLLVR